MGRYNHRQHKRPVTLAVDDVAAVVEHVSPTNDPTTFAKEFGNNSSDAEKWTMSASRASRPAAVSAQFWVQYQTVGEEAKIVIASDEPIDWLLKWDS
ncbi:hypothetical protein S40293_11071 [Stachybotrys chartarum IBT 40293]|nr:hypothetical protein S40293_11071 [Stachybotrys chartarum IBT 40293]